MNPAEGNEIILENNGAGSYELAFRYDQSLFTLSEDSLLLESGATAKIGIELNEGVESQLPIHSPIIIRTTGDYYPQIIHVTISKDDLTSIENGELFLPEEFYVSQPYPNPFNSSVRFNLSQDHLQPIHMDVYNLIGQKVYSKNIASAKNQLVEWGADDDKGSDVCSGIYFIKFSTKNEEVIRKTVLLK